MAESTCAAARRVVVSSVFNFSSRFSLSPRLAGSLVWLSMAGPSGKRKRSSSEAASGSKQAPKKAKVPKKAEVKGGVRKAAKKRAVSVK